ncbi:MAG: hypothetical protein LBC17_04145 [Lactobacillaceae bacterium]|jgi:hypothetical protein|nr:hypothetical protein [Lactobacillaceae bacterium]
MKKITYLLIVSSIMNLSRISNLTAAIPMSISTRKIVESYINAGMGAASIIALLGGGGLIAYIVKKAFETGIKKIIIAA